MMQNLFLISIVTLIVFLVALFVIFITFFSISFSSLPTKTEENISFSIKQADLSINGKLLIPFLKTEILKEKYTYNVNEQTLRLTYGEDFQTKSVEKKVSALIGNLVIEVKNVGNKNLQDVSFVLYANRECSGILEAVPEMGGTGRIIFSRANTKEIAVESIIPGWLNQNVRVVTIKPSTTEKFSSLLFLKEGFWQDNKKCIFELGIVDANSIYNVGEVSLIAKIFFETPTLDLRLRDLYWEQFLK